MTVLPIEYAERNKIILELNIRNKKKGNYPFLFLVKRILLN